ncbi:hypothetical protein BDV97DRAFT_396300 [Delphinella strobiligena]|nr:hypothetical protein BDV97DRAFT_396300 [Delphinella strobiligena]
MPKEKQNTPKAPEDVSMTEANTNTTPPPPNQPKRKKTTKHTTLSQFTIRNPAWSYIHLSLILPSTSSPSTSPPSPLDSPTAQLHLQSALSSFLGLHGTAVPIDFLKIEGQQVWLRVPREDVSAFVAAMGGWVGKSGQGWRVHGWGCWGADMGREGGGDLFDA